jgi:hypothetical protein
MLIHSSDPEVTLCQMCWDVCNSASQVCGWCARRPCSMEAPTLCLRCGDDLNGELYLLECRHTVCKACQVCDCTSDEDQVMGLTPPK